MSTLYIIRGKPRFQVFLDRVRCQQVSTVLGSVAQSMLNYAFICEEEVWPELIETFLGDASFGSTYFISRRCPWDIAMDIDEGTRCRRVCS